jgi:hypothetical protein
MNSLADIDFPALIKAKKSQGGYFPSPSSWNDEVLYFLLLDRFSNGHETAENLFHASDAGNAVQNDSDAQHWRNAGGNWCGGDFKGLMDKIPYLKDLGITAIWISPIFKQIKNSNSYHGYGIQDFLETDPDHFGTKEEFKLLVEKAHQQGVFILMDIILNHAGDVFGYDLDRPLPLTLIPIKIITTPAGMISLTASKDFMISIDKLPSKSIAKMMESGLLNFKRRKFLSAKDGSSTGKTTKNTPKATLLI